ncbi:MAG: hypothetical protein RIR87_1560, partial [Actinomycetota bacterium]
MLGIDGLRICAFFRRNVVRVISALLLFGLLSGAFTQWRNVDAAISDTTATKTASANGWNSVFSSSDSPLSTSDFGSAGVRITVRATGAYLRLSTTISSTDGQEITSSSQSGITTSSSSTYSELDWWSTSTTTGNSALRTLQIKASSSSSSPSITIYAAAAAIRTGDPNGVAQGGSGALAPNPVYVRESDSWFELVTTSSATNWSAAKSAAADRSLNGLTGRLASLNSSEESKSVRALTRGTNTQTWLGAADDASSVTGSYENYWLWSDGSAWNWNSRPTYPTSGRSINGEWQSGEPNSNDQDCLQIDWSWSASGYWDDLQCSYGASKYVAEYGGTWSATETNAPSVSGTQRTISFTNDSTSPTVTNVTSSTGNGTLSPGGSVSIQVVFSETITVTGTPQLTLETGVTDRVVNYSSGSGTTTLTFAYTVQAGDASSDLDYLSTTALALNGGTVVDAAGNSATLTLVAPGAAGSLSANKALVISSPPTRVVLVRSSIGTAAGAAFTTQPQVALRDVAGNTVLTDSSTVISASVSSGATLVGTTTATATSGVATFSNLGISGTSGTAYTITYSASYGGSSLTSATQSVTPTVGAAAQLVVTRNASGSVYGSAFTTQPIVEVRDSGGNKVTSASNVVTATPSSGSVVGSGTATASAGVATFSGLGLNSTPGSITVTYSATGLTSTTQTVSVAQAANAISFTNPGTKTWSAATFGLTVTATSGDTPTVTSSTTSVCTVSGTTVTMVGSGSCSLTASEDGNTNYAAASDVSV